MEGLENYLLPCLNKQLFGIDCPGCGMQRALIQVTSGNLKNAFFLYPAIFTLILLFLIIAINFFFKFKYAYKIKVSLIIINAIIIAISYSIKMLT